MMLSTFKNLIEEYNPNDVILPPFDPALIGNGFAVDFTLHAIIKYLRGMKVFVTKKNIEDIRPMI